MADNPKFVANQTEEEREEVKKFYIGEMSRRNAETTNEALTRMDKILHEGLEIIQKQQATLQMHEVKLGELQNALNIHKAGLVGRGPSVKE